MPQQWEGLRSEVGQTVDGGKAALFEVFLFKTNVTTIEVRNYSGVRAYCCVVGMLK